MRTTLKFVMDCVLAAGLLMIFLLPVVAYLISSWLWRPADRTSSKSKTEPSP